ncbi:MAG: hypothetical protein HPY60_11195 [Candidatus Methanofastidiosum sp.]|nr:hypothetical protein [Methanofastidiosum sp.]
MKQFEIIVLVAAILAVLLTAGCTSSPEKEVSNTSIIASNSENGPRYVQINFLDGTNAGGEYVSETAAFTTIKVMYILDPEAYTYYNDSYVRDPNKYIVRGNGAEVGFKNELINTMINIEDPESFIEKTQKEIEDEITAAQKAYEEKMEKYAIAAAEREAKRVKPNPK